MDSLVAWVAHAVRHPDDRLMLWSRREGKSLANNAKKNGQAVYRAQAVTADIRCAVSFAPSVNVVV